MRQLYYKAGQALLQNRAVSCYCKVGQEILQSKVGQVIYYRVGQSLLQSGVTLLQSRADVIK